MHKTDFNELDIQEAWEKLSVQKFSKNLLEKQEIMNAIQQESNSTISNLSKGLLHKVRYALVFGLIFIGFIFLNRGDISDQIFCAAVSASYFIVAFLMHSHNKKIAIEPFNEENILQRMKTDLMHIKSTLKMEATWGVIVFMSILAFYISKYTFNYNSDDPTRLVIMIVSIVFACVLLGLLSIKMNEKRFGKDLKKLEANIIRLETLS